MKIKTISQMKKNYSIYASIFLLIFSTFAIIYTMQPEDCIVVDKNENIKSYLIDGTEYNKITVVSKGDTIAGNIETSKYVTKNVGDVYPCKYDEYKWGLFFIFVSLFLIGMLSLIININSEVNEPKD